MSMFRCQYVKLTLVIACVSLFQIPVPLFATLTLHSSLSVTETYTDNLFFESKKNKRDDFGTFVIPSLTLSYESPDVVLSGTYAGVAQFYVNHPDANAYSHRSRIGIDLPFLTKRYKGLEVRLIESFNFAPALQGYSFDGDQANQDSPLPGQAGQGGRVGGGGGFGGGGFGGGGLGGGGIAGTSSPIGNQGVFTGRGTGSNSFQNRAGFIVRYQMSPRWVPNVSYLNRYTTFTDPDLNDSLTHTMGAGTSYIVSPRTRLNMNYRANISDIRRGETVVTHSVTAGVGHTLTPTVNFRVRAGASYTESADRITFTSSANITKSFEAGLFGLSYFQGVTPGGGLATSGVLTQRGTATWSYPLTERVSGFLAGGVAKNKSLSGNEVDVTSYQGQVGFSALLLPWLSGNISYSYIKQNSDGSATASRTATVNQGFIGLTARLPDWRIMR
ncbi:hypothetical protein [Candidatus Nitrospira salsa]